MHKARWSKITVTQPLIAFVLIFICAPPRKNTFVISYSVTLVLRFNTELANS